MTLDEERARANAAAQNAHSKLEWITYGARSNTDVPGTSANSIPPPLPEIHVSGDVSVARNRCTENTNAAAGLRQRETFSVERHIGALPAAFVRQDARRPTRAL